MIFKGIYVTVRLSGRICYDGEEIERLGENYLCQLGYLPQDFGYYPDFTAKEYLEYIAAVKGIEPKNAKRKIVQLLDIDYIADDILMMKNGSLILSCRTEEAVHSMDGKVWNCKMHPSRIDDADGRFRIVNLHHESGSEVSLRIVSDVQPTSDVVNVMPTLDDLYLYHFLGMRKSGGMENENIIFARIQKACQKAHEYNCGCSLPFVDRCAVYSSCVPIHCA